MALCSYYCCYCNCYPKRGWWRPLRTSLGLPSLGIPKNCGCAFKVKSVVTIMSELLGRIMWPFSNIDDDGPWGIAMVYLVIVLVSCRWACWANRLARLNACCFIIYNLRNGSQIPRQRQLVEIINNCFNHVFSITDQWATRMQLPQLENGITT